jgi:hypothetical protein
MRTREAAVRAVHDHGLALLFENPWIHSVGVGAVGGGPLAVGAERGFCVLVTAAPQPRPGWPIPPGHEGWGGLRRELAAWKKRHGVELRVERGGPFLPQASHTRRRFEALRGGISVSNPEGQDPDDWDAGTLTAFFRDAAGEDYLVASNHVIGHSGEARLGAPVVQPGARDFPAAERHSLSLQAMLARYQIATLHQMVPLLMLDPLHPYPTPNYVDLAVATLTDSGRARTELHRVGLGGAILGRAPWVQRDDDGERPLPRPDRVYKVGRSSDVTEGTIIADNVNMVFPYDRQGRREYAHFADQLQIAPTGDNDGHFSLEGDSGALILTAPHQAVGMLVGSDELYGKVIAHPFDRVEEAVESLLGGFAELVTRP